jgi:hypothetical protein
MTRLKRNANSHPAAPRKPGSSSCRMMGPLTKQALQRIKKTKDGKKQLKRFSRFWKIKCPPTIKTVKGLGNKVMVGLGIAPSVFLSKSPKSKNGSKEVRGRWDIVVDRDGKTLYMLSSRPIAGSWKKVGYASETRYQLNPDIREAGSYKGEADIWRHEHGKNDHPRRKYQKQKLQWPTVYADRGGKIDAQSNFRYGTTPSFVVEDWMYG